MKRSYELNTGPRSLNMLRLLSPACAAGKAAACRWNGIALATIALLLPASAANAGDATTSASAGSNGRGPGTATATAQYTGDGRGFTETKTKSGPISFGRGIAYGVDARGLTLSISNAVAGRFGAAVASTFNLSIGFDGSVASSGGLSVANGSPVRVANAGGFAKAGGGPAAAGATAGGHTGPAGTVKATTSAHSTPRRIVWR
jgi:hypothetical protein